MRPSAGAVAAALGVAAFAWPGAGVASGAYRLAEHWGSEGRGAGQFGSGRSDFGGDRQFDDPAGIAVDRRGRILAADPSNHRVNVYSRNGRYLGRFGRFGFDPGSSRRVGARGRLDLPMGLHARGNYVYVADNRNDRATRWTITGRWRARLGRRGSLRGQMVSPWGITTDRAGRVLVLDQGNYRVARFSPGGRWLGSWGRFGNDAGGFIFPYDIEVAPWGEVYVTDARRNLVLVYTGGGRFLRAFGGLGRGRGQLFKPTGIAIDGAGTVFVADYCNFRIQRFTRDGRFMESFGRGSVRAPTFLAVDRRGGVFVSDYHRILRFDPTSRHVRGRASHRLGSPTLPEACRGWTDAGPPPR